MANEEKRIWGIHTKDDNLFLKDNLIAIGWREMGDLSKIETNRDAFKKKYTATYPDAKKGSIATGAGMLYRFCHEAQGGDSGIDITAYKDELPPRILVQIKSQNGDINETTIQSLKGAMREGDYGLFVTLSNYTKNAQKYLESIPIIRGINGTELVELILKYYDDLSEEYRRMIPLKMVYIPVPKEE